ncbi:MAG: OmpH family outer membrane protein [Alkalispirochaetaceae bacterium]
MNHRTNVTRKTVAFLFFLFLGALLHGEQLTTVAVINIDRVYNTFYRDSQGVRELERLRTEYQSEIDQQLRELESLRDQRLQARNRGDQRRVSELDREILEMTRFVEDLGRRRREQLQLQQEQLLSNEFLNQLQQAIQFVAESQGYTVVVRSDTSGLQWWSQEVDISDLVLERLWQTTDR